VREKITGICLEQLKLFMVIEHTSKWYGPEKVGDNTNETGKTVCYAIFHCVNVD
jgi:hypothetical protein